MWHTSQGIFFVRDFASLYAFPGKDRSEFGVGSRSSDTISKRCGLSPSLAATDACSSSLGPFQTVDWLGFARVKTTGAIFILGVELRSNDWVCFLELHDRAKDTRLYF